MKTNYIYTPWSAKREELIRETLKKKIKDFYDHSSGSPTYFYINGANYIGYTNMPKEEFECGYSEASFSDFLAPLEALPDRIRFYLNGYTCLISQQDVTIGCQNYSKKECERIVRAIRQVKKDSTKQIVFRFPGRKMITVNSHGVETDNEAFPLEVCDQFIKKYEEFQK